MSTVVMPGPGSRPEQALIRSWITAFAVMTVLTFFEEGDSGVAVSGRPTICLKSARLMLWYRPIKESRRRAWMLSATVKRFPIN
jgi:hypothetical protein